jgi:polysaccharide pyruvyl transferase CsaB
MTKYVVSGYIGFDNFGDEAIVSILSHYLKNNGAEKVTLISSNPLKTSKLYGVESVGMFDFLKPVMETDVLISGGGSLLQDVTSLKSLIYYLSIISTALFFRKKVVIFAQGFTPFRTKIGEMLTRFVLKKCDKISVRDANSQEILSKLGVNSKLVCDPVFSKSDLESVNNIKNESKKNKLVVQLRDFPTLSEDFLNKLADEIHHKFNGFDITLLSLQDSVDLKVLENFKNKLGCGKVLSGLNVNEITREIVEAEYLVGMRFHACLIGAKYGVKVLGINYDPKVENLAHCIGFPVIKLDGSDMAVSFDNLLKPLNYDVPVFEFDDLIC